MGLEFGTVKITVMADGQVLPHKLLSSSQRRDIVAPEQGQHNQRQHKTTCFMMSSGMWEPPLSMNPLSPASFSLAHWYLKDSPFLSDD